MSHVLRGFGGRAADAVEQLQTALEGSPGFLGVVHDGVGPVVIVEAPLLEEWEERLAPTGISVARSCVDGRLLAAVLAVLPDIRDTDTQVLAGYDVLDDAVIVRGVGEEDLIAALRSVMPSAEEAAQAAIADGTLRIVRRLAIDIQPPLVTVPPRSQ